MIVDAAMNDLIRPALYHSHHEILPLRKKLTPDRSSPTWWARSAKAAIFWRAIAELPNVLPGDLLAVCTVGAYGFVAASNYNSRPRPPEILVEGDHCRIIRKRETYEDLVRGE